MYLHQQRRLLALRQLIILEAHRPHSGDAVASNDSASGSCMHNDMVRMHVSSAQKVSAIGTQWLGAAPQHTWAHRRLHVCESVKLWAFAAGINRSMRNAESPAAPGWRVGSRSCGWSRCWWSDTRWVPGATGSPPAPPRCSTCAARATRWPARWAAPLAAPVDAGATHHIVTSEPLSLRSMRWPTAQILCWVP